MNIFAGAVYGTCTVGVTHVVFNAFKNIGTLGNVFRAALIAVMIAVGGGIYAYVAFHYTLAVVADVVVVITVCVNIFAGAVYGTRTVGVTCMIFACVAADRRYFSAVIAVVIAVIISVGTCLSSIIYYLATRMLLDMRAVSVSLISKFFTAMVIGILLEIYNILSLGGSPLYSKGCSVGGGAHLSAGCGSCNLVFDFCSCFGLSATRTLTVCGTRRPICCPSISVRSLLCIQHVYVLRQNFVGITVVASMIRVFAVCMLADFNGTTVVTNVILAGVHMRVFALIINYTRAVAITGMILAGIYTRGNVFSIAIVAVVVAVGGCICASGNVLRTTIIAVVVTVGGCIAAGRHYFGTTVTVTNVVAVIGRIGMTKRTILDFCHCSTATATICRDACGCTGCSGR